VTIPHPRPTELTLSVEREPVNGECPACGESALQRYPVLAEGGWFEVVKCANCLHSVSRDRGPRLGPIQLLSDLV
jgi:vanillate/4-hydroxybenzoate decarboxylase subunit D